MLLVTGSRMTRVGSRLLTIDWKLGEETMFLQSIWYQFRPTLIFCVGSKMNPIVELSDFSAFSAGLPANTPEICTPLAPVTGSFTCTKKVATDGEISGSDGARNPRPQFARISHALLGLNLMPTFGVVDLP